MTEDRDKQRSEFQDINRNFQRVDESSVRSEEEWMILLQAGGYSKLQFVVDMIDIHFRQYRPLCTEKEKKDMDDRWIKLRERAGQEITKINNARNYGVDVPVDMQLIKDIREYLCMTYELRHSHNLLIRTIKKPNMTKRIDNAIRF